MPTVNRNRRLRTPESCQKSPWNGDGKIINQCQFHLAYSLHTKWSYIKAMQNLKPIGLRKFGQISLFLHIWQVFEDESFVEFWVAVFPVDFCLKLWFLLWKQVDFDEGIRGSS